MPKFRKVLMPLGAALASTKLARALSDLDLDDVLEPIGLRRRRSYWLQDLGLIGAGLIVGGALAIIFAPASGRETRSRLMKKADELGGAAADKFREMSPNLGNSHMSEARES